MKGMKNLAIRFGAAGNSASFYAAGYKSSLSMPEWLACLGSSAYEYQCVRGVHLKEETGIRLGRYAEEHNIALSVHAPYYISLGSIDQGIREKTKKHFIDSMGAAK